jgi:hypothetical protein
MVCDRVCVCGWVGVSMGACVWLVDEECMSRACDRLDGRLERESDDAGVRDERRMGADEQV